MNENINKTNEQDKSAEKKAGESKPIKWWLFGIGGALMFALAIALAIAFNGFKTRPIPEEDRPIEIYSEPNVRVAEKTRVSREFIKGCTLEQLTKEADAVALIRIGNWLGDSEKTGYTGFASEVKEVIKGELGKKITVLQEGTSKCTVENHPIFTGGNDLLLFLKKANEELQNNANNAYRILGGGQSVFYTTLLRPGSPRYAVTLESDWLKSMPLDIPNIADVNSMWKDVFSALAVNDVLWDMLPVETRIVYSYELIKAKIQSYLK